MCCNDLQQDRHALVDLSRIEDPDLSSQVRLRAFLKALKYNRRRDLPDCFGIVVAEAPELHEKDLLAILNYLSMGPIGVDITVVHETLTRLMPERKERIMGSFSQPYYDQGKAEGKAEGGAKILARILEKRFGAIPGAIRQRILAADVTSIETWAELAVDAPDLQSVFKSN